MPEEGAVFENKLFQLDSQKSLSSSGSQPSDDVFPEPVVKEDQPRWVEPGWVEPRWVKPRWVEPGWVEPRWVESRWVEPRWVESRWVEPRWVEFRWVEPRWVASQS